MANSTDCFRWDFATSVEEVMTHLHAYVMAKQVLYIGVSDTPAWVVVKANACTFDPLMHLLPRWHHADAMQQMLEATASHHFLCTKVDGMPLTGT
jgi:aryl-alcohol dehydrogenase-like predicted oxidoreductase